LKGTKFVNILLRSGAAWWYKRQTVESNRVPEKLGFGFLGLEVWQPGF